VNIKWQAHQKQKYTLSSVGGIFSQRRRDCDSVRPHSSNKHEMDDWVQKALQRWPNVPALFGWLSLDRRGRWLIKGEAITHPRIVDTINRNYGVDEHGRWYFQNGPQRGYFNLEYAPFVLRRADDNELFTHNDLRVERPTQAFLDEAGTIGITTEYGFGEVLGSDLDWLLERLTIRGKIIDEEQLSRLLDLPSAAETDAIVTLGDAELPVVRLDAKDAPELMNFSRDPQPIEGERVGTNAPD